MICSLLCRVCHFSLGKPCVPGLSQLEDENNQLREQNLSLSRAVQQKRRSSVSQPNTAVVTPRSSTTTTITTTVVATPSRTPAETKGAQEDAKMELQVLQASVERLEAQLEKAKEAAMADRQAAQAAQTALWKKEKEVSNAKLDQRIAEREARTAQETIKKMEVKLIHALWPFFGLLSKAGNFQKVGNNVESDES